MNRIKSKTPESIIRRLIERNQIARIEIESSDGKRFHASAFPASHHPIVRTRREAQFAATGKTDFTIAEAQTINNQAYEKPMCRATGETIEAALATLAHTITEGRIE